MHNSGPKHGKNSAPFIIARTDRIYVVKYANEWFFLQIFTMLDSARFCWTLLSIILSFWLLSAYCDNMSHMLKNVLFFFYRPSLYRFQTRMDPHCNSKNSLSACLLSTSSRMAHRGALNVCSRENKGKINSFFCIIRKKYNMIWYVTTRSNSSSSKKLFVVVVHSSEIRDLLSMKCSSEILTIKFAILCINKATYAWVILYIKYSKV